MLWIVIAACSAPATERPLTNTAPAARAYQPLSLVGRWRVIGCETSPQDPADCGRGEIVFTADHVTIDVPAAEQKEHAYTPLSSSPQVIAVEIDGDVTNIKIDANGEARWRAPGLGGRVGELLFVRAP
jgi:hypothetical protein